MYIDPTQIRIEANELNHFGILGMKWGVRRYQNADGSLTAEGVNRYRKKLASDVNRNWVNVYNNAAERSGEVYAKVNAKHNNVDFNDPGKAKENYEYMKDINKAWRDLYVSELSKRYSDYIKELGTDWMEDVPMMNAHDADTLYWKKIVDAYAKG